MKRLRFHLCSLLTGLVMSGWLCGCATSDSDRLSERPWNAPRSWEHGIPPGLMEGR